METRKENEVKRGSERKEESVDETGGDGKVNDDQGEDEKREREYE